MLMRKLVFGLALATSLAPSAGHAQVTLNMTQVTLRELSRHVARAGSRLLRLDERLVQPEIWVHHGWFRRLC
jgi:hypothetical protein